MTTTSERPIRRPGEWDNRPLSGKKGQPVPRFTFAIPPDLNEALAAMAHQDGQTMSEWVRDAIITEGRRRGLLQPPET